MTCSRPSLLPRLVAGKRLKILDFDIENRPLSYLGMDFTTSEITSIAASFHGEERIYTWLLGVDEQVEILEGFRELYDAADIITGHYIRAHDLPIITDMRFESGLPNLEPKLTVDTKTDLIAGKGISKSQENLSEMLELPAPKVHMNTPRWRKANRLTEEGIALTRKRVEGDIVQHKALYAVLVSEGRIKPPVLWQPGSKR
jgi:hypothetical protein